MFFYLLCSLVLAANLPSIDDYEDKSDAREQRKQERERFGAGEAQAGSSSISVFDVEAESATIGDGREEIGGADNNGAGEAQAGSSSISVIDVEEENASIGDGREEIVDANNNAVSEAQSGSSSIAVIDVEEENASAGDGREEGAHVNNNAVGEAQAGSSSRIVGDAKQENTFISDNREEIPGAKNKAVSEGQARSKTGRLFDVVREDGFFSVPLNEDTAASPVDAGETYFDYEQLKFAVLSEEGVPDSFLGQGTIVVTAEGVDGKKYRWRIAQQIGRGAYGTVYRADKVENLPTANTYSQSSPSSSSSIDTMASVAIKVAWSERARDSLIQEANRLNQMKNTPGVPQLVSVARFGKQNGVLMASEFFPRGDLERYLKENPTKKLSFIEMWETAKDAFMKLDAIHRQHDIRHGDIKPSNLFLDDHNKIVFGDWGNGRTFTAHYASESFLAKKVPSFRDDFVSLFLSIFQMDHTLTYDNNVLDVSTHRPNNVFWRVLDPSTRRVPKFDADVAQAATTWDKDFLASMVEVWVNNQYTEDWITLWSTILNAARHEAGLSDQISMMFGATCYVF